MEFCVLGPLAALHDGVRVKVGGPRQQVVLGMLLLEAPRVVAVDALVDAVWPDDPPATARAQIQIVVSRLRQHLQLDEVDASIVTRAPGYLIELGTGRLDLREFEMALAEARRSVSEERPRDAVDALRRALALWDGPPLAGLDCPPLRDAATRLADRRLGALEDLLELELALGRHAEVVDVAACEIDRHPLRDRLRGQLMLALHRSGRQAEALAEFQRARRISVEELGLEPRQELRRLEQAILADDPSLARSGGATSDRRVPVALVPAAQMSAVQIPAAQVAASVPRMLPAPIADFVGRADALDELSKALVAGSSSPVVVVSGPGGTGKSALLLLVAHRAADQFPDGQLFVAMHGTTVPVRPAQALERFLRALGVQSSEIPESLDERGEMYRERLADRRVLVVLDDIASVAQVLPLMPPDGGSSVLVASRRRITALPGAWRHELGTFSPDHGVELLRRVVGADRVDVEPEEAVELVRLCGHLPLAVRIAAARLAARPHWSLATMVDRLSDDAGQLDELRHEDMGVRASLLLAYQTLDMPAQALLRLLSLVEAPEFGSWVAPLLLDASARLAEDVLGELVEVHLVEVVPAARDRGSARYRLHDLVRIFARERAVQEDATADRETAIRRLLGGLLHLLTAAHRREYGGDYLVIHGGEDVAALDGRTERLLLREPLQWLVDEHHVLVAAVAQAAALGWTRLCWDIAVSSVTLFEAHAHYDDWRATHAVALAAARRAGDRLGEAAVLNSLGSIGALEQVADTRRELANALVIFTELDHRQGMAMTIRNQAYLAQLSGTAAAARPLYEQALAAFIETGDRAGAAWVLGTLAQLDIDLGRHDLAMERLTGAAAICDDIGNRRIGAQVVNRLGQLHLKNERWDAAGEAFGQVLAFAGQSGDRIAAIHGGAGSGAVQLGLGQWGPGRATLIRAAQLAAEVGEHRMHTRVLVSLSAASLRLNDLDGARAQARAAVEVATGTGSATLIASSLAQLGDVEAAAGNHDGARSWWQQALDAVGGPGQDPDDALVSRLTALLAG